MEEPSGTLRAVRSSDTDEPEEWTETTTQDMEEPSGTLRAGGSSDTEECEESTEATRTQDMEEPSGTLRAGGSSDTEECEESTETTTTQDMEEPSGTLRAGGSSDTDKPEEWTETSGGLEGTEEEDDGFEVLEILETEKIQDTDGPSGTQISPETENKPDTETPKGAQSLEVKTDVESVPLDSQTGALVPVQDSVQCSPLYYLWRLLRFWSWFGFPTSQTPEEDPASFGGKISKIRSILLSGYSYYWWYFERYSTVGIFSRSSESDYEWLMKQLKSEPFHSTVSTVLPHYISNKGMREFRDAVSRCTFGILYHTKNRGRINIVGVTDSLYDEELKYLSERLGKENVIVVVDDLEDTSDVEKTRILESQPSIGTLARDLFLFSANDKPVTISEITQES